MSKSYNKLTELPENKKKSEIVRKPSKKPSIAKPDFATTPSPRQSLKQIKTKEEEDEHELLSLLEKFQLDTNVDADELAEYPNRPRFFSKLSVEGQSALLKTYEDTIVNELKYIFPTLTNVPRVATSKFRKIIPTESQDEINVSNPSKKAVRIESFMKVSPFSLSRSDPIFKEHQLTVSQQLEIAQQILDLLNKIKKSRLRGSNTTESIECLKTYVAFANIWTKYFRLS
jgi:hypothetical protein